uniref:Signal peptidase complex subunit 2 n=1 Tax=Oryctolagus cuniculus TaxID=9986 RepID=A0A5F9DJP8_RABIT
MKITIQYQNFLLGKWKVDDKLAKIDKWDRPAVKNSLDDSAKNVLLEKYKSMENFGLIDRHFTICTISCFFAIVALIWDYMHPFLEPKPVLALYIIAYCVMGFSPFIPHIRRRASFSWPTGKNLQDIWQLSSSLKRFSDKYTLKLTLTSGRTKQQQEADGMLVMDAREPEISRLHDSLATERKIK